MHTLFRKKIGIIVLLATMPWQYGLQAQTRNLPLFDESRWIHFGFTLGSCVGNFKYEFNQNFYSNDTLMTVEVNKFPGLTLGAISDLHVGEFFDIRALPSLVLAERGMVYNFKNFSNKLGTESIFFEVPIQLKFKSERHNNFRLYVIGGTKFSYDFGSDAKAVRNPSKPIFAIQPWAYAWEYGIGFDLYTYYFKFSPEIKLSKGLNDILDHYNDVYSNIFERVFSNFIFFSFHFEG